MGLRKAIFDRLKTGTLTKVYNYESMQQGVETPYVVLKEEPQLAGSIGQGLYQFRVFVHMMPGSMDEMDSYLLSLQALFKSPVEDTDTSKKYQIETRQGLGSYANSDDGTISRERLLVVAALV